MQKKLPETEEDYLDLYQDRILNAQKRQLFPLQEDLADWLNKTLGKPATATFKLLTIIFLSHSLTQVTRHET